MHRKRSDPARIRFTGPDGPVGARMLAQPAAHTSSPDPLWVHADSKKRNHQPACTSAWQTPKESSMPPAAVSASARQRAPRRERLLPPVSDSDQTAPTGASARQHAPQRERVLPPVSDSEQTAPPAAASASARQRASRSECVLPPASDSDQTITTSASGRQRAPQRDVCCRLRSDGTARSS